MRPEGYLTTDEAAVLLNRKPHTLRLWVHQDNAPIPFMKKGWRVWWLEEAVRAMACPTVPAPADLKVYRLLLAAKSPRSVPSIANTLGLSIDHVREYLRSLHRRKLIRVAKWERRPAGEWGGPRPCYLAGGAPDAKRPPRMTQSEASKRWRKANPEMVIREKWNRKQLRYPVKPDFVTGIFMRMRSA